MAKCHRNNVDSLILHRIPSASSSSNSGNAFSGSAFRRMIFDAISCGGSSRYRRDLREADDDEDKTYFTKPKVATTSGSKSSTIGGDISSPDDDFASKSERLCDLLNLEVMENGVETKKKKKEETSEVMKHIVRDLQVEATARRK